MNDHYSGSDPAMGCGLILAALSGAIAVIIVIAVAYVMGWL